MAVPTARQDPVLVFGMHNSGTSMIAEILHRSGVFMQANMGHFESRFFSIEVNDELAMGGGGSWARLPIMPVSDVLELRDKVGQHIEQHWLLNYRRSGYDGHSPWGFKDPRLCVLLPLYLELFPEVKLIYIRRSPDNIAASLACKHKMGVGVLADPDHWRSLAIAHMTRAEHFIVKHGSYCVLQYEDFCVDPCAHAEELFSYLGLELGDETKCFLKHEIHTDGVGSLEEVERFSGASS